MRARSREINIFNMSLLDILTGMLGAFLFLMLGLVPYYMRAKNQQNNPQSNNPSTPQVDTLLDVIGQWNSTVKMDLYLYDPNYGWAGVNSKNAPLPRGTKIDPSACGGDADWQNVSTFAHDGCRYLITYSLEQDESPADLQQLTLSIELLAAQSKTDGSGIQNFCPLILCPSFNPSGSKPNTMYGLCWITVSKDTSKPQYYQQWSFSWNPATSDLPSGVYPMPAPVSTASATPAPANATSLQPTHSFIFDWFHKSSPK
jgi:hypothetical protein